MAQSSDVVLNGDPYMLVASKGRDGYSRSQDGIDEGRTARVAMTDFFGGTRRALQLERDRGLASFEVGPALGGQGVTPWPFSDNYAIPLTAPTHNTTHRFPSALIRDYLYWGIGQYLYRSASLSTGLWNPPTMVYDAGAGNVIHSIIQYGWNIMLSFGETKDITHGLYPDFSSPAVLFTGSKGFDMVAYQGFAIWADARASGTGYRNMIEMVTGSGIQQRRTAMPITRVTTAQGEVVIATENAIYTYSGRIAEFTVPNSAPPPDTMEVERWTGDVSPFFEQGAARLPDDYRFVLGFGGRTYAWLSGMVLEHDPNGERAGWRDTGLSGAACHGACVASGYLVVTLTNHQGVHEVWAWDGSGWWLIDYAAGGEVLLQPIPAGNLDGMDVFVPIATTQTMRGYRLIRRAGTGYTIPAIGPGPTFTTSMLDAADRDKDKAWRKIGASFSNPVLENNTASADDVTVFLDYSVDGGATWAVSADSHTATANTLAANQFELEASLSAVVDPWLMLRVRWAGTFDWAPVLTGLWAEYETLDNPARRRRWAFTVSAEDQVIDRDGAKLTRTGRQQISELWSHWQNASVIPFRDLDFDTTSVTHQVRIVGITETVPVPHQAGKWGQSAVALVLVEV